MLKAIAVIALCGYYYILAGIIITFKWIWRAIRSSWNSEKTTVEQDDLEIMVNRHDQNTSHTHAKKQWSIQMRQDSYASRTVATSETPISSLWNSGSEIAWHEALDYYYESLKDGEQDLDCYMEDLDADEIARLSAIEFYDFLYDKYFVWKYTAKNRLATTRMSLERYIDENRLSELEDIQKRLFSADRSNIEHCLRIASEIHGLGPAGASGLLAILFPESFGTIDQYVVKALKGVKGMPYAEALINMNPDSLSIKNGVLLIQILREQATCLNKKFDTDFWNPRKIDMVLWAVGRVRK